VVSRPPRDGVGEGAPGSPCQDMLLGMQETKRRLQKESLRSLSCDAASTHFVGRRHHRSLRLREESNPCSQRRLTVHSPR